MRDCLVSLASTALLHNPDLEDPEDGTRISLLKSADEVAEKEGEFILKLALYCRQELNIRTTANFLLAYASLKDPCKPYLQRYFKNSVRLPSDWMQVADMVCSFGVLDAGSLPAVLRRAMVEKFVDFDAYQLAKHKKVKNSEIKFPNEAQIQNTTKDAAFHDVEFPDLSAFANPQPILDWSEPLESDELRMKAVVKNRRKRFNLKRLIRLLHIREPTFHVMGILGKRYPNNREDFLASRLPEMFDQSQAGKRMKLPTPETWETQIANEVPEIPETPLLATVEWSPSTGFSMSKGSLTKKATTVAWGNFTNAINQTGWSFFEVETDASFPDEIQAHAAGYLEGQLTSKLIYWHWINNMRTYCQDKEELCQRIVKHVHANTLWIQSMVEKKRKARAYWHQVGLSYDQYNGLVAGYNSSTDTDIIPHGHLFWLNLFGDIIDLEQAYTYKYNLTNDHQKDYKRFKPGRKLRSGLLWILEQFPGHIHAEDMTKVLEKQSYWSSYNVPFFSNMYNLSHFEEQRRKYGNFFSHDQTPRALIFKRDQPQVVDLKSAIRLMRSNNYKTDPLSICAECDPPYNAEYAISARNDLNERNGTYPLSIFGEGCAGGYDMKITNKDMFEKLEFIAQSGPTFDSLPPFQWSKSDFDFLVSHVMDRLKEPPTQCGEYVHCKHQHGNKAAIWESLIDNKKLPYMATIRNLRNLILTGIDDVHVQKVAKYISNEKAVIGSRMFPFQFYTAFDVLRDLDVFKDKTINQSDLLNTKGIKTKPKGVKTFSEAALKKKIYHKLVKRKETMNSGSIKVFQDALEKAVAIASNNNIPPIKGSTLILFAFGTELGEDAKIRPVQKHLTPSQMCCLTAVMLEHTCEDCEMVAFGHKEQEMAPIVQDMGLLSSAKFLANSRISRLATSTSVLSFDSGALDDYRRNEKWIDNLVVIHGPLAQSNLEDGMTSWLAKYRHGVNPDLVYANINLDGSKAPPQSRNANDIFLVGFSEQIFHALSNSSRGGQLERIESIDRRFKLAPLKKPLIDVPAPEMQLTGSPKKWRQIRVFVSSTFTDMHGERDLINRFVMPELQRRAKSLHMDVRAIDLRWGILPYGEKHDTNEDNVFSSSLWRGGNFRGEANGTTQVMACLREIEKCHLFIGLLGDRYGWKPPLTASSFLSENELSMKLEALKGEMGRASITELEMEYAALHNPEESRDRAFFFLRDSSLLNAQLPPDYAQLFKCQDEEDERRLQSLKQRIISSGLEVFNGYPAHLDGGENQGKPITVGLEALGQRILDSLWNSLLNLDEKAKRENEQSNHTSHSEFRDHEEYSSYIASHKCVSRSKIVDNIHESLGRLSGGIVELTGNPGSGLSTLMCQSFNEMKKRLTLSASQKGVDGPPLLVPFFSASSQNGTGSMQTFLKYLVQSLSEIVDGRGPGASTKFQDHELQQLDAKSLGVKAASLLNTVSEVMTSRGRSGKKQKLVLFVDGLEDYMEQAKVYWLPPQISNGVILVVSSHFGSKWNKHLQDRKEKDHRTIRVGPLTLLEKKALVRHSLAQRGKKLDETAFNNELNLLVSKRDASNPAYLSLLTNEMAGFGVFEDLQSKLSMAGNTMSELLSQILERLEIDLNEELVANAMCCLALSAKLGLTENELHSALALLNTSPFSKRDVTVAELSQILSEGQFKPIPPLQLSILINGLESFLQPTQGSLIEGLLLLKKGEWLKSVTERYFSKGCHSAQNIHLVLAGVFHHIYRFAPNHPRALQGLPEHLASTGNVKLLEQTICSLDYIRECAAFPDILQELALRHFNGHYLSGRPQLERFLASEQIKAYSAFVHLHWTSLIDQPSLAYQLALTEPQSTPPHKEAVAKTMNNGYDAKQITTCSSSAPLWLFWENRSEGECLGENNEGTNNLLAVKACKSSRMAVICLEKSSLISPEELLVACGHDDGHIIVGLAHNNEELFSLVGHSSPISSLTFLPGTSSSETCLVSGSQDGMISFWDLNSQIRTNSVQGHSRCVSGLACSSDGLTLVSVGWDGRIKIWSGRSQREMSCIQQSTQAFNCVAFHPDKDYIIAGGWDGLLKIYDLTTLERKAIVRGHLTSIQCVAISSDGKKIVSGSSDGVVKVFDSGIGGECGSFRVGHCVHSIALDNSRINTEGVPRILIGTRDGVIHFWTTDEGTEHPSIVLDLESDLDLDVETVIDAPTDFEITCNGSDMETDEIGPQTGLRITSFCILPCLFGVTDTNMALGCADGTLLIVKISSVSKTVIMRSKIANGPIIGTLPITWENLWTNSTFDECHFCLKEFVFVTNQMGKFESYLISGKTKALDQEEDQISSSEFKFVHKGIFESRKAGSITGFLQASESDCYFGCIHENQDITIWSKKGIEIKWINMERQGHSLVSLSRQSVGGSCLKDEDPSTWYLGIFNPKKMRGQFQMFDIFNAKLTESYIGHNGPVTALNMAHDRVFSASRDGTLRIWDAGKRGTRLNGSPVVGLVACNGLILTVCRDGSLVSHEVEGGHSRVLGSFFNGQGHTEHIRYASLVSLQEAIVIIVATNHRALRVALLEGEENHLTFPYHKYFSDRELLFFGAKQSDPQTCILTVLFDKPRISGTGEIEQVSMKLSFVKQKSESFGVITLGQWALKGISSLLKMVQAPIHFHGLDLSENGSWISSALFMTLPELNQIVITGDTQGLLTIDLNNGRCFTQRIHNQVITGLLDWSGRLVSISLDDHQEFLALKTAESIKVGSVLVFLDLFKEEFFGTFVGIDIPESFKGSSWKRFDRPKFPKTRLCRSVSICLISESNTSKLRTFLERL
eukprot:TCALIF_04081-PA protein Name:"Similar to Tep1 Telomerase protein component 1 (Rattus norvegicus)" AED:0.30 eAED:0.29 QI:0/0.3/0.18/0.63/1/1/11/0/2784